MTYQQAASGILFSVLVACSGRTGEPAHTSSDSSTADSAGTPAARMQLQAMPMLPGFRAHLDSLAQRPGMMHSAMSAHQSEVKHLVAAMHSDMMGLGMHSDAAYEALADSVVQGSAGLASAAGADFNRRVAQHIDQLRRLTAAYETKTAAMK